MKVAGADVCRGRWYVAVWDLDGRELSGRLYPNFGSVLQGTEDCAVLGVDIPIGLPESGARPCDGEARALLGKKRASVFPAPVRPVLTAQDWELACAIRHRIEGKRMGKQAFGIVAKVREVDELMTAKHQDRVLEVHPELCFRELNGGVPAFAKKREADGFELRRGLLKLVMPEFDGLIEERPRGERDDVLDALAAAWTARRVVEGTAKRLPKSPEKDAKGLRMEMWF